jgi:hypothetical protein
MAKWRMMPSRTCHPHGFMRSPTEHRRGGCRVGEPQHVVGRFPIGADCAPLCPLFGEGRYVLISVYLCDWRVARVRRSGVTTGVAMFSDEKPRRSCSVGGGETESRQDSTWQYVPSGV